MILPDRLSDPVLRRATRLMMDTAPGPQRDYFVAVRMAALRNPRHGYVICHVCGEPHRKAPGNHTRAIHGKAKPPVA